MRYLLGFNADEIAKNLKMSKQQLLTNVMLHHVYTFEKLDSKAKKLIITPILDLVAGDERASRYRNINSTAPMEIVEIEK